MNVHIALTLLLSALVVSARSLENYKCREYPVVSSDPSTSLRTVRVCEVIDNGAPTNRFQMASEAEDLVKPSLSSNTLYNTGAFWPNQVFQQSLKSWPLQPYSYNNIKEQFLPIHSRSITPPDHTFEAFNQIGLKLTNHPSNNNNELNTRNIIGIDRSLQQQLNLLVKDVSEVKDSITNLVPYLKDILKALLVQSTNVNSVKNVNVNLKLDPVLEALLRQFIQLTESRTETKDDQTTNNTLEDIDDEEVTTEDSSEEETSEMPNNFSDSSTEQSTTEESEEVHIGAGEKSLESVDSWIRRRFGPSVKPLINEDEMDKTSEEENSAEKSDEESFETWFNYVYRSVPDESTSDYNLEVSTQNSHDSNENSEENEEENLYKHTISKSSQNSKKGSEYPDNNYSNVNHETVFIPQEDKTSEYLKNGGRYDYTVENNKNAKYVKSNEITANECIQMALSIHTFDDRELFNKYNKCIKDLFDRNNENESSETELEDHLSSTGSKESGEDETANQNSNESKDSEEIETTTTGSSESNESGEIESTTPNSTESKESGEIESTTPNSNESKDSDEIDSTTTNSNESKESYEADYNEEWGRWLMKYNTRNYLSV